ncbi:CoA transferase family III [Kineococcus xinjiangensis]|uniref:CoA transferase family III n=1 Tax=Kineococcus xinjiangensis TaxID=512762 RepID=A0A2S6ITI2_9ACTN|nr:CoA transferase [Kineococcus xinjiangensis]PPK97490.1 CoA transferase family III [Kineococcus xinjiangensis]
MLDEAWAALGGDPELAARVAVTGSCALRSPLPVGDLAVATVAAQRLAAEEARAAATGAPVAAVALDAAHVGLAFRSERHVRLDGRPAGAGFHPSSRFAACRDGWVRLHANYPHHRVAAEGVLGTDVAAGARSWAAAELEEAVVAAGGVAAAVRTPAQWRATPQGAALTAQPLVALRRVGDAPPRPARLAGLRVLDLTRVIAGPVATRTLASYGADVLRVDCPRLPEDPAALLDTGPGKRSTLLDLAVAGERAEFDRLAGAADVVVLGYRPGALAALGVDAASLTGAHPGLVVLELSAWGAAGPWALRRGFDSVVQAACGIASVCAAEDGTPGALPAQALDHGTGHLLAAAALRAVTERSRHGGGWTGALSLARTASWLLERPRAETDPEPDPGPDPGPYLADLGSPWGTVTLVRPPGSPLWRRGPVRAGSDAPGWLPR